jgi:hypothetical protein
MEGTQMNQSQQAERARNAVSAYVESVDVPQYDAAGIAARTSGRNVLRTRPRTAVAALASCAVVAIFVVGSPVVFAQVERMLHAFATVNGQTVPVAVNSVTIDQARRDMPFAVIAPSAVPAGLDENIDELSPTASRLDSHLIFRYNDGEGPPALTIVESSAHAPAHQATRLWMTSGNHAPAPALPAAATGEHAIVQFHDGQTMRQVKVAPISWVVRGTRIDLIATPGMLSGMQLAAIRREMSR